MKNEVWVGYIIIGYVLLPFIAIFNILKKGTKDMSDTQATFYYFFLFIIVLQLIEFISYL